MLCLPRPDLLVPRLSLPVLSLGLVVLVVLRPGLVVLMFRLGLAVFVFGPGLVVRLEWDMFRLRVLHFGLRHATQYAAGIGGVRRGRVGAKEARE